MSHLLSHPHPTHRPYLFELPRPAHPITPPDTDNEFVGSTHHTTHTRVPLESENHAHHASYASMVSPENFVPIHRKIPSIPYVNSSLRDSRERTVHRGLKHLVVVFPPTSFSREHGQFGHTLSSGPMDRLSQGILIPLYPTMSSQLGAIAREFNLPSITGLCLYLRTTQNGLALNPRLSDDSWPLLWSHLFDARSPSLPSHQLPISGQIEFDIDLGKARWYDVWIGASRKDVDVPQSVAASRPMSQWRGDDSRTSIADEHGEEQLDDLSLFHQARTPFIAPRLGPRKLSLLDRFDSSSVRSAPRAVPRHLSPQSPTGEVQLLRGLSPIVQEEEPMSARKDIDKMVNSWRASASASRSPLAATGQTSLDPANLPNTLNVLPTDSPTEAEYEMNLDDYTWSISSAGPPEYDTDEDDFRSWVYPPSVPLERRVQGSVLLTPSTHTSFGPPDDDYDYRSISPISLLPSPDIAMRHLESAPLTPATATSWGAPLSYPPSPLGSSVHRAPSVDIAWRTMHSRPITPATATSWGAPSYPASPFDGSSVHRVPSVDIAYRQMHSRPVTPATATSWGAPSYPSSPLVSQYAMRVSSPDLAQRGLLSVPPTPIHGVSRRASRQASRSQPQQSPVSPSQFVNPYYGAAHGPSVEIVAPASVVANPWQMVFPYYRPANAQRQAQQEDAHVPSPVVATSSHLVFPYYRAAGGEVHSAESAAPVVPRAEVSPSQLVFPYYQPTGTETRSSVSTSVVPQASPSQFVFPYYNAAGGEIHSVESGISAVPPAEASPSQLVFPYYHAAAGETQSSKSEVHAILSVESSPSQLVFPYYTPSHLGVTEAGQEQTRMSASDEASPSTLIFPYYRPTYSALAPLSTALSAGYPHFNLYPAVYPRFELYPAVAHLGESYFGSLSVHLGTTYPVFDLYPSVYPHFEIYPGIVTLFMAPTDTSDIPITLALAYPIFRLYPAVYPYNLQEIYPSVMVESVAKTGSQSIEVRLPLTYPSLELYPSVYPFSIEEIYPSVQEPTTVTSSSNTQLPLNYPHFSIYPAVYPHSLAQIYPPMITSNRGSSTPTPTRSMVVKLPAEYPTFDIYHSVYPHSLDTIYPARVSSTSSSLLEVDQTASLEIQLAWLYPDLGIYAPVYPYNVEHIYAVASHRISCEATGFESAGIIVSLPVSYPNIVLYPPVYPWSIAEIYPAKLARSASRSGDTGVPIRLVAGYPLLTIYAPVYPHNLATIYPPASLQENRDESLVSVKLQSAYPFFDLYPTVYPYNLREIYPRSHAQRESQVLELSPRSLSTGSSVTLASVYPFLCPYPPVYPHFSLYPEAIVESVSRSNAVKMPVDHYPAFNIYPSVYPYIDIYPAVWKIPEDIIARRRHKYTHSELHYQVFPTHRRTTLSHADLHNQVPAEAPQLFKEVPVPIPAMSIQTPPSSAPCPPTPPRSRGRSGTVSTRPMSILRPVEPSAVSPDAESPSSGNSFSRKLPSLVDIPTTLSGYPSRQFPSHAIGLPAHPAVARRFSSGFARPVSSSFAPLPTLVEPDQQPASESDRPGRISVSPTSDVRDRPSRLPRPSDSSSTDLSRSGSSSATLPRTNTMLSAGTGSELSRSKTMPTHLKRPSLVRERARAFDMPNAATTDDAPTKITMATLAQFPAPPRPPLPSPPSAKIISKLDRSKYPFA